MKRLLTVMLMIYILSSLFFLRVGLGKTGSEPGDFTGTFVLREKSPLRISIDHGWERDGRIPVILAFKDLEICMRVETQNLPDAAGLNTGIHEMLFEDKNLPFLIYEQNLLRTRMKLLEPMSLKLIINAKGQVEIFLGCSRLYLHHLRVTFRELKNEPGNLYQLTFEGLKVFTRNRFVFSPSRGSIYAALDHKTPDEALNFDAGKEKDTVWSVWAIKITQGKERVLNRDWEK